MYIVCGSVRQYRFSKLEDIAPEKVFTGEISRLGSFANQKPSVLVLLILFYLCVKLWCMDILDAYGLD